MAASSVVAGVDEQSHTLDARLNPVGPQPGDELQIGIGLGKVAQPRLGERAIVQEQRSSIAILLYREREGE
jgi:hypothetical protein